MPFIAYRDGEYVIPKDVDDSEDVVCPDCEGLLRVRGPFDDGRARHFFHADYQTRECPSKAGGGGGGPAESEVHQQLKAQAVASLREEFTGEYEYCRPEVSIEVDETITNTETRRADVLMKFAERNEFYGKGIIVEVQHLNAGKDIRATTHDYLKSDFSIYWATVADFDDGKFLVGEMNIAFNERQEPAFSAYYAVPPALDAPDRLISPDDHTKYTTRDLVPECDHEFVTNRNARHACVRCGMELEICYFSEAHQELRSTGRLRDSLSYEEIFYATDVESVDYPVDILPVEKSGDITNHTHGWGRGVDIGYGQKYRCSRCNDTMVVSGDQIAINGKEQSDSIY